MDGVTFERMGEPSEGRKDDSEKVRADLYSGSAYLATCRGLTYGAKKYAAWNWAKGILYARVYAALLRHLFAWWGGEEKDPESGLSHLDHAGCCLMFLQHYHEHPERYKGFDDRPHVATAPSMKHVEAKRMIDEFWKDCPPAPRPPTCGT